MPITSPFIQDLLARLPEADRGSVLAALDKPEAADAVKYLDEGAKRQNEFSRSMDEGRRALAAKEQELQSLRATVEATAEQQRTWYEANQAALAAGWEALKATGTADPARPIAPAPATTLPPDVVRRADVEKLITEREMGAARYIHAVMPLALKHFQEFGEVLDLEGLLKDPKVSEIGVLGVYETTVAERRKAAQSKADEARVEARVQERLAQERKRGIPPPYPVSPQDVSPLDQFAPSATAPHTVDAAVDEYTRLVQQRHARETVAG